MEFLQSWNFLESSDARWNFFQNSSREYDSRSAEASIEFLDQAFEKYSHVRPIREVITDHYSEPVPRSIRIFDENSNDRGI
ncbi:MAG: hypothetical protein ACLFVB_02055 [Thermoplasmata archaeon]